MKKLQVLTWTPSRYAKHKECAAKVKYQDLMCLCPMCFEGRISGGYNGEPVVCDTCDLEQPKVEALERGNLLDAALTGYVAKAGPVAREVLDEATRHPEIKKLALALRSSTDKVTTQESIVLDKDWKRVSQFTKNAWARLKLDVLRIYGKGRKQMAEVIDWKSGNIDKAKGVIREREEYYDSMRAYQIATLSVYPEISEVSARMAFIDAPPKLAKPFKSLPVLTRAELPEAQAKWEEKVTPLLNDTIFAPRPGIYCKWCPYAASRKGPCPHGKE